MKMNTRLCIGIVFIALVAASFFAGSYMKEQEYSTQRIQRCNTLISFAIDKAENMDLSDQDTMEALISNVYAAYEYCDNPDLAKRLHDLWNTLIFEGDGYIGKEDVLGHQLRDISEIIKQET